MFSFPNIIVSATTSSYDLGELDVLWIYIWFLNLVMCPIQDSSRLDSFERIFNDIPFVNSFPLLSPTLSF